MKSAVAGVLNVNGDLRVVVTQRRHMHYHVEKGEQLFVVPGLKIQEPVPWNDVPPLIETVQRHVAATLAPVNHCGECRACCRTLYIADGQFRKPSNQWCEHCAHDFGCKIYPSRPSVCRAFECTWLQSQRRNDRMPPGLRPDRCGAIFTSDTLAGDQLLIECHGKPNAVAWEWINEMQRAGYRVKEVTHYVGEADA